MHNLNENALRRIQSENHFHVTVPKETFIPTTESTPTMNGLHSRSESHPNSEILKQQQSLPFDSSLNVGASMSFSKNGNRKRSVSVRDTPAVNNARKKSKLQGSYRLCNILLPLPNF